MKARVIIALLIVATLLITLPLFNTSAAVDEIVTINGIDYVQTFEDEFEGNSLDSSKWELCPEWGRQGNYCYWDDDMTSLDGEGHLVLTANYDDENVLRCGAVRSRNKFYQKYGYFEIKLKLQSSDGFWSAFWLMPDSIDNGTDGGADGTEIDIYEAFSLRNSSINHAIHYDGYSDRHRSIGTSVTADVYDGDYHTFALDWSPEGYVFYIDGVQSYTITSDDVDICEVENYLKISLESGSWTGLPDASDLPDGITVDYVKVYQRAESEPTTAEATTELPTAAATIYGDANDDNVVDSKDILLLRQHLADWDVTINLTAADADADGAVNARDLLLLRRYYAQHEVQLGSQFD